MGLGQLFEIKPRCCRGSLLRDELGLRRFETRNDLTRSFPRVPAGTLGRLGSPNLAQAGRFFGKNLWPSAIGRKVIRIVHKPVALAWRQRASSALRARAAATLPPAFMNNSHDFCPTRRRRGDESGKRRGVANWLLTNVPHVSDIAFVNTLLLNTRELSKDTAKVLRNLPKSGP